MKDLKDNKLQQKIKYDKLLNLSQTMKKQSSKINKIKKQYFKLILKFKILKKNLKTRHL